MEDELWKVEREGDLLIQYNKKGEAIGCWRGKCYVEPKDFDESIKFAIQKIHARSLKDRVGF